MNFLQMYTEAADQMKDDSTANLTRIKRWLNMAQQRVLFDFDWPQLRRDATLSVVASTRAYILPGTVIRFLGFPYIPTQGKEAPLRGVNKFRFHFARPGAETETTLGQPEIFVKNRWVGVLAQPSAASVVTVVSSVADTATVTIEGIVSGEIDREVLTLAGTAPVAGTKSFTEVLSISKSAVTAGRVTATSNSGAVTLGIIGPLQYTKRYLELLLDPIPDAPYTVNYSFIPWLPDMVNPSDSSLLPERHHELVIARGLMYAFMFSNDSGYRAAESMYSELMDKAREEAGEDAPEPFAWAFGGDYNTAGYGAAGDYDSYLRSIYWGG